MINCKHWKDCGSSDGGICTAGVFERPSHGVCNKLCIYNTSIDGHKTTEGIKKQPLHKRVLRKVKAYVDAEKSLATLGEVDEKIYVARIQVCLGCEHLKQTYDEVGHCGACGCGISKRAALTVKGKMPRATCPKDLWDN